MHCYLCSCWRLAYIAHDPSVVAGRVCMESSWIFIRHFWLNERNGSAKCRPRSSRSLVRWMFLSQRVTKGTVEHSANCLYSFDVINIRHRINYHHDLTATKPKMTKKQQVEKKDQQMLWFGAFSGHKSRVRSSIHARHKCTQIYAGQSRWTRFVHESGPNKATSWEFLKVTSIGQNIVQIRYQIILNSYSSKKATTKFCLLW